jgi:hypothetical protein
MVPKIGSVRSLGQAENETLATWSATAGCAILKEREEQSS